MLLVGGASATTDLATRRDADAQHRGLAADGDGGPGGAGLQANGARRELTIAALPNGSAAVAGGQNGTTPKALVDLDGPPLGAGQSMLVPRAGHTATALRDAAGNVVNVLYIGGVSGSPAKSTATAEIYGYAP